MEGKILLQQYFVSYARRLKPFIYFILFILVPLHIYLLNTIIWLIVTDLSSDIIE